MKKLFIIVFISHLLLSCTADMNPYFGYKPIGYNKKLHKATWHAYNAEYESGEWTKNDLDWIYSVSFNENGNIIEANTYDANNTLKSSNKLNYFEDNKVISKFYGANEELSGQRFYELVSTDRYEYKENETDEALSGYIIFSNNYGKDSRLVQEYTFLDNDAFLEYESLTEPNKRYKKYFDENQKLVYETRNEFLEFNAHGDWTKAVRFDEGEGELQIHLIYREFDYYD
ncbi:hypothetical protein [Winogradskyella poriferorum]|uniref:hypothetical protein n=1 Tax=Winogradskyella poriferorum TaxID=307627 RepID=UPI003D65F0F7